MKRTAALATLLVVGAGSAGAGAVVPELRGSDTLETLTQLVVMNCAGAETLMYIGGGSTNGENSLISGEQLVSPMSRFLQTGAGTQLTFLCTMDDADADGPSGSPAQAEGLAPALDGLAITASASTAAQCDTNANGFGEVAFSTAKVITVNTALGDGLCTDCDLTCSVAGVDVCTMLGATCNTTGTCVSAGTYTIRNIGTASGTAWRDASRVLWAGMHHSGGNTQGNQNCDSAVRFSLANTFANLFQGACAAGPCTQFSHVWRRGDLSGTTDTFISLLGLPAITTSGTTVLTTPFCNGLDTQDLDPIRRPCAAADHVCQARNLPATPFDDRGTTGLVLPMFVPEALPTSATYPTTPCSFGQFRYRPASFAAQLAARCPHGGPISGGQCLVPLTAPAAMGGTPACRNPQFNCPGDVPFGTDCRVFNLDVRANTAAGGLILDEENRQVTYAFYRIRGTDSTGSGSMAGSPLCQEPSATRQIGCLSDLVECSVGFAGREAIEPALGAVALDMNNIELTVANVRLLLMSPVPATVYPLARQLWVNTLVGFENIIGARTASDDAAFPTGFSGVDGSDDGMGNVTGNDAWDEEQRTLAECFADSTFVDTYVTMAGFVTNGTPSTPCRSYNETLCGAAGPNTDSCTDNAF